MLVVRSLIETVLMRGHNICFHCEIRKIVSEFSSVPIVIPPAFMSSSMKFLPFCLYSFVCSFVHSFITFRHVRRIYLKVFG